LSIASFALRAVDTLPSCGPLECYEILYKEIIPFMRKVIDDPLLLM
jgi:hypothetical protein